jgi:hypothetical protein
MTLRRTWAALVLAILATGWMHAFAPRNRWAQYESEMQDPVDDPPDAWVEREFVFGRLRYDSYRDGRYGMRRWGVDANRGERQFFVALRRLSLIDIRSVEEIVNVSSDDMFDFPFLYAVAAGHWTLKDSEAERLGKYFERGGFLVVDDLHNEQEWADFMAGIEAAMPGRTYEEIPETDPIFHVVHNLDRSVQISGFNIVRGSPYERGGYYPGWRGIRDSKGRIVASAWFNQDLGDAWEYADYPIYPEQLASLAFRFGTNWAVYALTH